MTFFFHLQWGIKGFFNNKIQSLFFDWNLLCHGGWLNLKLLQQCDTRHYFHYWISDSDLYATNGKNDQMYLCCVLPILMDKYSLTCSASGTRRTQSRISFFHASVLSFTFADLKFLESSIKRFPITPVMCFYWQ